MADLIQLLPDTVSNQIAAGEVIQRPASALKELMENSLDAGATEIHVAIKEAGSQLIQIIDNGKGMSETDARMCFERHATSKIRSADDLFAIRTMGFRGEAMASIAAVAQVELRTRQATAELGTRIVIEGGVLHSQEFCSTAVGTHLSVKNLFYNVPARRKFLKSPAVEMRHIIDEFQRIALAHPDIHFTLHHNGQEMFRLPPVTLKQRIIQCFGDATTKKLIPVEEQMELCSISGFIGRAEYARKSRGEQFLFVNHRFIRNAYLHHAITTAFDNMLQEGHHPLYVLFLEIDPAQIDINVHPTKQEIKFEEERLIYNYVLVAVKHALGQYALANELDFTQDAALDRAASQPITQVMSSAYGGGNPFSKSQPFHASQHASSNIRDWEKLYQDRPVTFPSESIQPNEIAHTPSTHVTRAPYQIQNTYILNQIKSGFILIDQQAAHERILYEEYLYQLRSRQPMHQRTLFPQTIEKSTADAEILRSLLPELQMMGWDIAEFGQNVFIVHGIPAGLLPDTAVDKLIDQILEQFRNGVPANDSIHEQLAIVMARHASIKRGKALGMEEMEDLIDKLFACSNPYKSPGGRHCFITLEMDELSKRFAG